MARAAHSIRWALLSITLIAGAVEAAPLDTFKDCAECPEMIELPVGAFTMGARANAEQRGYFLSEANRNAFRKDDNGYTRFSELPLHRVEVNIPFAMSRNEITYNQWMACVRDGGCGGYVPPDRLLIDQGDFIGGDHPVTRVSFENAKAYAAWLNLKSGTEGYRLPTEAEWEYAARAGTETHFAQGETITPEQVNFSGKMTEFIRLKKFPGLVDRGKPVPVTELDAANRWGLRHMSGNVSEWTLSCFTDGYAGWSATSTWLQQSEVACEKQILRGGHFESSMETVRVAHRSRGAQRLRLNFIGFRILKELDRE